MAKPSKATLRRRAKSAPRYKSGPKKGQFKPRGATKKRRRKKAVGKKTVRRRRRRTAVAAAPKRRRTRRKSTKRSAAAKKAARTRKRRGNPSATNPRRRRRRKARRNPVARRRRRRTIKRRRNPRGRKGAPRNSKGQFKKGGKRATSKRRKSRRRRRSYSFALQPAPRKRRRKYRMKRTTRTSRSGKQFYAYSVSRSNPGGQLKGPLMAGLGVFGGVIASRMMGAILAKHVLPKVLPTTMSSATKAWIGAVAPGLSMFLLATFVAPKVIKGKPNVVRGLQMGSVVALADGVVNALIASGTIPASVAAYVAPSAGALSGFGAFNYSTPLAEYVDYDNRLGEYVDFDNRLGSYGGDATEPLSADELAYFQSGGAGGVFNKTVFHGVG